MVCNQNLKNAIIAILVPLPSIIFYLTFLNNYHSSISIPNNPSFFSTLWTWCCHHPLLFANALFFFNVNIIFWLIGQIQSSHWVHTNPIFHHINCICPTDTDTWHNYDTDTLTLIITWENHMIECNYIGGRLVGHRHVSYIRQTHINLIFD